MDQRDVLELKTRLKKDRCSFQRIRSVYVNSDKQKVTSSNSQFLALEDDEAFKYLEIAKKTLSGKIDDALLNVDIDTKEQEQKDLIQLLNALKASELKDDALTDQLFDRIIDTYNSVEPFYIVLFYDAYDVPVKTSDNNKLDESELVYEYLLCSICPVKMSKPGLGYLEDKNVIGSRNRDWVVQAPDIGFLYPAFNERCADVDAALFFSKNTKEPDHQFMEQMFGSMMVETKTEKKEKFAAILNSSVKTEANAESITYSFHEKLNELAEERADNEQENKPLTADDVKEVAKEAGMDENQASIVAATYKTAFKDHEPSPDVLVDDKLLGKQLIKENTELKARIVDLMKENENLRQKLKVNSL